jgi:hypothetical protein
MSKPRTHFEQIPIQVVKQIAEPFTSGEGGRQQSWRDVAEMVQNETDSTKMIELVEKMITKYDQEQLSKRPSARAVRAQLPTI